MVFPGYFVAIIGGAVAGSEAAVKLAERGIYSAVFEQNELPYGKLETGLPKWHINLRNSQENKIDQKLKHPLVTFVPCVKLGRDLDFKDIIKNWGFSAILLAIGAWRDRSLEIKGIDNYINKGLYYQNSFVAWYNRNHDPDLHEQSYDICDQTVVIGGGLASLDVMKILSIETARQKLEKHGIHVDAFTLEKRGVYEVLKESGLSLAELQLNGCALYYRRRLIDMPLNSLPEDSDPGKREKALQVRYKIMDNFLKKYFFKFYECANPVDTVAREGHLIGLKFQKTEISDGRVLPVKNSEYKVICPRVISAIGSIPEPIPGIPFKGDMIDITDKESGQIAGYDHVFALGNAVTGRGNIKESQMHGRRATEKVMDEFLVWREADYEEIFRRAENNAENKISAIEVKLQAKRPLNREKIAEIFERLRALHKKVSYNGDYDAWIKQYLPLRVENMI